MPFLLSYTISADTLGTSVDPEKLDAEIIAAGPYTANYGGVSVTPDADEIILCFDAEPSAGNVTTIVAVLGAHDHDLETAKTLKVAAIDAKTVQLISNGFVYATKTCSLSLSAQSKMTAAHQIKDHVSFVYPVVWNNIDDTDTYSIPDAADMDDFYMAAIGTIRAHLDSGTVFKDAVRAAIDIAGVDAVVDNR